MTHVNLTRSLFDLLGVMPTLGAAYDTIAGPPAHLSQEEHLYDWLRQARNHFDDIPDDVMEQHERGLDDAHWLAVVAWRLFGTETDDLNEAEEAVLTAQDSLVALRATGKATAVVTDLFITAVQADLNMYA